MPKSVKRPVMRVNRERQHSLFGEVRSTPKRDPIERPTSFNNPDPGELRIGANCLDAHLKQVGERDALVMREMLQDQDWSAFEARYSPGGRRAYHPALMTGIVLYGLLRGVSSLRDLERLARVDLGCWWVSGGILPDHSVLGRFINHHEADLSEGLFEGLLVATLKRTSSDRRSLAGDGTVVEAMSSRYGVLKREAAKERVEALHEAGKGDSQESQRLERMCEALEERRANNEGRGHERLNPQEPDAVVVKQKNGGGSRPGYVPTVLANDARVVVDAELGIGHELAPMETMIKRLDETTTQLLLDSGFRASSLLDKASAKDIEVLAPAQGGEPGGRRKSKRKYFRADQFSYDVDRDEVICPAGAAMRRIARYRNSQRRRYRTKACFNCPLHDQCTSKKQRIVERTNATVHREQLALRMSDPHKQARYRQRKAMVEPVFSVLRLKQGFNRFRRRHARGARLELMLHLMAYNVSRAIAARYCRLFWRLQAHLSAKTRTIIRPNHYQQIIAG